MTPAMTFDQVYEMIISLSEMLLVRDAGPLGLAWFMAVVVLNVRLAASIG